MNRQHLTRRSALLSLLVLLPGVLWPRNISAADGTGPWNLPELKQVPAAEFGPADGLVQPVYYAGEPLQGKPTRIFAWYAQPEGKGPFPGVVLVHGGGGKAFREWALHWTCGAITP